MTAKQIPQSDRLHYPQAVRDLAHCSVDGRELEHTQWTLRDSMPSLLIDADVEVTPGGGTSSPLDPSPKSCPAELSRTLVTLMGCPGTRTALPIKLRSLRRLGYIVTGFST